MAPHPSLKDALQSCSMAGYLRRTQSGARVETVDDPEPAGESADAAALPDDAGIEACPEAQWLPRHRPVGAEHETVPCNAM